MSERGWRLAGVAGVMFAGVVGARGASMVLVNEPLQRTELVGASQTAAGMAGMRVTARFADGSSATGLWVGTGVQVAGQFQMFVGGTGVADTGQAGTFWDITNLKTTSNLVGVSIDGQGDGGGNTVFDVSSLLFGLGETPGSNAGSVVGAVQDNVTGPWTADVTYSGAVQLGDAAAVGDVYRFLALDNIMWRTSVGLPGTLDIRFGQDTDVAVVTPVPEPAGVLVAGAGVLAMWRLQRLD